MVHGLHQNVYFVSIQREEHIYSEYSINYDHIIVYQKILVTYFLRHFFQHSFYYQVKYSVGLT